MLVKNLGKIIDRFIDQNNGECMVFSVGVNVRLDEDDFTVVIPDITVLCDRSKLEEKEIVGAQDWVIEMRFGIIWNYIEL